MIDCLSTEGYLRPSVPMKVVLKRSDQEFYMITDAANQGNTYKFEIDKIGLWVPIVKVNSTIGPMMEGLCEKEPARYTFDGLLMKQYAIGKGTSVSEFSNIFTTKIPQRFVIAFYTQKSLRSKLHSPFFTSTTLKIKALKVLVNGIVVREVCPDFDSGNYILNYRSLTDYMGVTDRAYMIG